MGRRQRVDRTTAARNYVNSLSPEERKEHFTRMKYPSGQGRRGAANRAATLRREVRLKVTRVAKCEACGGVGPEVLAKTDLFDACTCTPVEVG